MQNHKLKYILELADNSMILGQRLSEWCGHGPILEQDIAITNISLDLIGEARNLYQYAADIEGNGKTEDDYPFIRKERQFYNCLLTEMPNQDWAYTMTRQLMFDCYHFHYLSELSNSSDIRLSDIANRSVKEASYHLRFSSEWVIRLGDGTDISHEKMQMAINDYCYYFDELFMASDAEKEMTKLGIAPNIDLVKESALQKFISVLNDATLLWPENIINQKGGKMGLHTEHLGYILTELQYLQRTYPNLQW